MEIPLYVLYALCVAAIITSIVLIDTIKILPQTEDSAMVVYLAFLVQLPFLPLLLLYRPLEPISTYTALAFAVAGLFPIFGTVLYLKSLSIGDATRLVVFWRAEPLFALVLATLFLGEVLSIQAYLGVFLMLFAVMLVVFHKTEGEFKITSGAGLATISAFCWGANGVVLRYLFIQTNAPGWTATFYNVCGSICAVLLLLVVLYLKNPAKTQTRITNLLNRTVFPALVVRGNLGLASVAVYLFAVANGPVSVVAAIVSSQAVFLVVALFIISKLTQFKLDSGGSIFLRVSAAICVVLGVFLVA